MSFSYPPNDQSNDFGSQRQQPVPALAEGMTPFVRRTYTLFLYGILGMVGAGVASYQYLGPEALSWLRFADAAVWIAIGWLGWRRPAGLTLTLFTVISGLTLGALAHFYAAVFLTAAVLAVAAFVGLSVYVHTTKKDFDYLRGGLNMMFWVLLAGAFLVPFVHIPILHLLLAVAGTATFGGWILYDTSKIIERADDRMTPGVAALELLLDFVGLLRYILRLLDAIRR